MIINLFDKKGRVGILLRFCYAKLYLMKMKKLIVFCIVLWPMGSISLICSMIFNGDFELNMENGVILKVGIVHNYIKYTLISHVTLPTSSLN